jgi:hypothetical protein
MASPLGRTRPAPWIQTGVTGASGKASARRATPPFSRPSWSPSPRVPSGNTTTMSPAARAARAGASTSSPAPAFSRATGTMPITWRENQPITGSRRK